MFTWSNKKPWTTENEQHQEVWGKRKMRYPKMQNQRIKAQLMDRKVRHWIDTIEFSVGEGYLEASAPAAPAANGRHFRNVDFDLREARTEALAQRRPVEARPASPRRFDVGHWQIGSWQPVQVQSRRHRRHHLSKSKKNIRSVISFHSDFLVIVYSFLARNA